VKYNKSLFEQKECREEIFKVSTSRAKCFLTDIFNLNFKVDDTKIINICDNIDNLTFEVFLNINGRNISALFFYENNPADKFREALIMSEIEIKIIPIITNSSDNFKNITNKITNFLESFYDITFTPLDPQDIDSNIKSEKCDEAAGHWKAEFTTNDHEAVFTAEYEHSLELQNCLKVTQFKKHIIYFD